MPRGKGVTYASHSPSTQALEHTTLHSLTRSTANSGERRSAATMRRDVPADTRFFFSFFYYTNFTKVMAPQSAAERRCEIEAARPLRAAYPAGARMVP